MFVRIVLIFIQWTSVETCDLPFYITIEKSIACFTNISLLYNLSYTIMTFDKYNNY